MLSWHILQLTVPPPSRYPDLYWVANNAFSFTVFVLMDIYAVAKMYESTPAM